MTCNSYLESLSLSPEDVLGTLDKLGLPRTEGLGVDPERAGRDGVHAVLPERLLLEPIIHDIHNCKGCGRVVA